MNAQRQIRDTIKGANTVNFTAMAGADQLVVLCTEVGGTADGTLVLQGSTDGTTYVTVSEKAGEFSFYPNDTLTITDGAGWLINITGDPFNYYKVVGAGTTGDTTAIDIEWAK